MPDTPHYQWDKAKKALSEAGFANVSALRNAVNVLNDPSEIAELFDIDQATLMDILLSPDLSAIDQLGGTYITLLHDVGIETVAELSRCNPFELHEQITSMAAKSSARRLPNRATLEYWIEQARNFVSER